MMLDLELRQGSLKDYAQLAEHHYRAARPATATRVLALRDRRPTAVGRFLGRRDESQTVGVLVESLPSLSCRMRDHALGGRYTGWPVRQRAKLLNTELRCISRVIVHPQWRGLGLAVRLVKAALDEPTTRFTEALAAMGRVHPFFERAGMAAYPRPPHAHDVRLLDALRAAGLDPLRLERQNLSHNRWLRRELDRWRRARRLPEDDPLPRVAERLLFQPVYYLNDNTTVPLTPRDFDVRHAQT